MYSFLGQRLNDAFRPSQKAIRERDWQPLSDPSKYCQWTEFQHSGREMSPLGQSSSTSRWPFSLRRSRTACTFPSETECIPLTIQVGCKSSRSGLVSKSVGEFSEAFVCRLRSGKAHSSGKSLVLHNRVELNGGSEALEALPQSSRPAHRHVEVL